MNVRRNLSYKTFLYTEQCLREADPLKTKITERGR